MEPRSIPRIVVVVASSFLFLGLLAIFFAGMGGGRGTSMLSMWLDLDKATTNIALPTIPHRKLLNGGRGRSEPNRIWGDKCSKSDIVISQGPTGPLPNGIPSYTVEIMNMCAGGCDISGIHLACGWFSSARLINPKVFKRLRYNDCLVNDGKPLRNGASVSFQYANTFLYPLSVASVVCT